MAVVEHQLPDLADAGAGKSAVPELDVLEPDGRQSGAQPLPMPASSVQPDAVAELCTPDAGLSAEQSFAVPAPVAERQRAALVDAVAAPAESPTRREMLEPMRAAQPRLPAGAAVVPDEVGPEQEARALLLQAQAFPPAGAPQPIGLPAQAAPGLPRELALKELLELVESASRAAPRQVSPQLAARPGAVAAELRPLPSSAL